MTNELIINSVFTKEEIEILKNTIEACIYSSNFVSELRTIIGLILVIFQTKKSDLKKNIRQRQLIQER